MEGDESSQRTGGYSTSSGGGERVALHSQEDRAGGEVAAAARSARSSSSPDSLLRHLLHPNQLSAMISNFSTSYNVVSIAMALPILQSSFLPYAHSATDTDDAYDPDSGGGGGGAALDEIDAMCASALLGGMVLGQLVGGAASDTIGRIPALYGAILLQVVGSLGSALVGLGMFGREGMDVFDFLSLWRFVLGVGAGAIYPIAAVLSAESEEEDDDGLGETEKEARKVQMIAITFSTQGVGFLAVPALAYLLMLIVGEEGLDLVWRLILGIGALPGVTLVLLRCCTGRRRRLRGQLVPLSEPLGNGNNGEVGRAENTCWDASMHSEIEGGLDTDMLILGRPGENAMPLMGNAGTEAHDEQQHLGILQSIKSEPNLLQKLLGTAGTWFLFDILFYGNTLFQPIVLESAFGKGNHTATALGWLDSTDDAVDPRGEFDLLVETSRDSLFLSLIALPGYFVSIAMLGRTTCCGLVIQTPRYVQMQGFFLMAVLYALIGVFWESLTSMQVLLVLLYGSTFFFANYGPNATTFLLPSVTYSHNCRSTLNGISAAFGKMGALLGASVFPAAADILGDGSVMTVCSGISVVALILTWKCVLTHVQEEESFVAAPIAAASSSNDDTSGGGQHEGTMT